jgi:cation:H+ antiporter
LLIFTSHFIVRGATAIAAAYGIDAFTIGAIVVAVGTSAPELATAVIAKLRGYDEVGVGTLLGSNVFNGLCIVGIASSISPAHVRWEEAAIALAFGAVAVLLSYPSPDGIIGRGRGMLLLTVYGGCFFALALIS